MYVKRLFPIIFFLLPISLLSQSKDRGPAAAEKAQKKQEKKALIYQNQHAYGFNFHTDGWSFFYEKGKYKTITKTGLWWVSFGERKHPKEERIPTVSSSGGLLIVSSYTYGKVNNFYSLNVGIGEQRLIGGKGNKNGVAVSLIYGGAFAAGLLRPYYIEVLNPSTGSRDQIRYTTTNKSLFLDPTGIIGKGGITKGWNEVNFVPGFQAKTALRFDYGRYNELLSAIEV